MARIDKAPEGGKFRAKASTALGGTAGAWGDGDLLCVDFNAAGELIAAAAAGDAKGVILTTEGKRDDTAANYKQVIAQKMYTVFTFCEVVELELGGSPPTAGDPIFAAAAGGVQFATAVGAMYIGQVLDSGSRAIINVNGQPVG